MLRRPSILALLAVLVTAGLVRAADAPAKPTLRGFKITTEGGVEGKQTVEFGPDGRPLDGPAMPATTRIGNGRPLPPGGALPAPVGEAPATTSGAGQIGRAHV